MPEARENILSATPKAPKKLKQYRCSQFTVAQYKKLGYRQQREVNAACDAGEAYELDLNGKRPPKLLTPLPPITHHWEPHPDSGRPLLVGKRVKP